MKFLLTGVSTRALAQSAVRAGYQVVSADYFGDRDLCDLVDCRSLSRTLGTEYNARYLPKLAQGMNYDALAYVSSLENHPDVVGSLAGVRPVFGNTPGVLRQVRHWPTLRRVCAEENIAMPMTLFPGEEARADRTRTWLRKPVLSGGGHGILPWDGTPLGPHCYIQVLVPGVNASAVFVGNGKQSVVLGLSEQLIGRNGLGAKGFRHCGNITPLAPELGGTPQLFHAVREMLERLTRRFHLRGVCGADFIISRDENGSLVPVLLEINPRPSSSAELLERTGTVSIFDQHVMAAAGKLPVFETALAPGRTGGFYQAKGILFARWPSAIPETMPDAGVTLCDVGQPGDKVLPGRPICSLLTAADTRAGAIRSLFAAADTLGRKLRIADEEVKVEAPIFQETFQRT